MKLIYLDHPISDSQRSALLFSGHLLVHTQSQYMLELIEFTKTLLTKNFEGLDPVSAQKSLTRSPFLAASCNAQIEFRNSSKARQLFFKALAECGVNLTTSFFDHFPLRVVPFAQQHTGAHRSAIGHHRDTWGSNIHCQQNWWAPIFELTKQRTIAIYPDYWQQPIANTTETWCFKQYLAKRNNSPLERSVAYPSAPSVVGKVNEKNAMKLVIKPGELLNFSSAHLHASVPNTSTATRYSVEMRTISIADIETNHHAPNLDNKGREPMYSWFKNMSTNKKLVI